LVIKAKLAVMSEFVHVLNRGVDKRDIVLDDGDRARFLHDLYVFNDAEPAMNFLHHGRQGLASAPPRNLLVHIHAFALMMNHYHLLLSACVENGISLFMKKLNMGYTKYFNEKYERVGTLWQSKYKGIAIERDAHFLYIPYYIHLNPLDYTYPEWRKGEVRNPQAALRELDKYRWSSHLDYIGIPNFPSLTYRHELEPLLGNRGEYERNIRDILRDPSLADGATLLE